jgi:hypothetical protein
LNFKQPYPTNKTQIIIIIAEHKLRNGLKTNVSCRVGDKHVINGERSELRAQGPEKQRQRLQAGIFLTAA